MSLRSPAFSISEPEACSRLALRLGRIALVLLLGLVIARATMLETLREPVMATPNTPAPPRAPGADTSILLDWISFLPALLVCVRGMMDRRLALRNSRAAIALVLLGVWAIVSTLWATDRFSALVSGFHLLSAGAMFWATIQLVRDWASLRLIAGVCAGLLLILVVHGGMYALVDAPELRRNWEANKAELLRQRGWEPDSFAARQLEKKINSGEVAGFSASPNTYGAELVLLLIVMAGVGVQRFSHLDKSGWWGISLVAAVLTFVVIGMTKSKTAFATPALALLIFAALVFFKPFSPGRRKLFFGLVLLLTLLGFAAVVGHGLAHGTLPSDSLAFRWRYWIGSWRIFIQHLWIGVGWGDFGWYYLATRLPIAAEEIKDPHNLFVRVFVELGLGGGVLCLAWLIRSAWEVAVVTPEPDQSPQPSAMPSRALPILLVVGFLGICLNILCTIDWAQESAYNAFELLKKTLYLCVFMLGAALTVIDVRDLSRLDDRPSPWLLRIMVIAAGMFLVHNLIDFSLWENGAGGIFFLVLGAAIGLNQSSVVAAMQASPPPVAQRAMPASQLREKTSLVMPLIIAGATGLLMLASLVLLVTPVVEGEGRSRDADDFIRAADPHRAINALHDASAGVPYNADYAFRLAQALAWGRAPADDVRRTLNQAINLNPMSVSYRLLRASFERNQPRPDETRVLDDLKTAQRLNPNDVQLRQSLAETLASFGHRDEARAEYQSALQYNELLHPDEPRRLSSEQILAIRKSIQSLN